MKETDLESDKSTFRKTQLGSELSLWTEGRSDEEVPKKLKLYNIS